MRQAIMIGLFLLMWFGNSWILQRFYDVSEYYGWVAFVQTRFIVYETMFLILALVCVWSLSGLGKALSVFAVIMIAGSVSDKVFFGERGYIWTDLVLIIFGIVVSIIVYGRTKLDSKDREFIR